MGQQQRAGSAGVAHLELVSGVVQLRPQDAMVEAMLRGWRAQQTARGLKDDTVASRERLVRQFLSFHQRVLVAVVNLTCGRMVPVVGQRKALGAVDGPCLSG